MELTWEALTEHFDGSRSFGVSYFLIALFQRVGLKDCKVEDKTVRQEESEREREREIIRFSLTVPPNVTLFLYSLLRTLLKKQATSKISKNDKKTHKNNQTFTLLLLFFKRGQSTVLVQLVVTLTEIRHSDLINGITWGEKTKNKTPLVRKNSPLFRKKNTLHLYNIMLFIFGSRSRHLY